MDIQAIQGSQSNARIKNQDFFRTNDAKNKDNTISANYVESKTRHHNAQNYKLLIDRYVY